MNPLVRELVANNVLVKFVPPAWYPTSVWSGVAAELRSGMVWLVKCTTLLVFRLVRVSLNVVDKGPNDTPFWKSPARVPRNTGATPVGQPNPEGGGGGVGGGAGAALRTVVVKGDEEGASVGNHEESEEDSDLHD